MQLATNSKLSLDGDAIEIEGDTCEPRQDSTPKSGSEDIGNTRKSRSGKSRSTARCAILFGLLVVAALAALVGWLGFRDYQSHQAQLQRSQFLRAARQGALNLTTIDWQHADSDVRRILDGSTGEFYDDFAKRSQPFIEVLKQVQATTVGTITEAGLESETIGAAEALVAVSVQTSDAAAHEQVPRVWRMRISVQKVGDQIKVSNVGFVP